MNNETTSTASLSGPITLESLRNTMRKFNEQFPASKRVLLISMNRRLWIKIEEAMTNAFPVPLTGSPAKISGVIGESICGISVKIDDTIPSGFYRVDFADGSTEIRSAYSGDVIRLPAPEINQPAKGA